MKPELYSSQSRKFSRQVLPKRFWLLGTLGFAGTVLTFGAVPTQAETEGETAAPLAVEAVPPMAPVETAAEALLMPQVTATPAVEPVAPAPAVNPEPSVAEPAPAASAPAVEVAPQSGGLGNSVFIDPTDYSLGATPSPDAPALVFSDRSTGCQFTLQQGQSAPNRTCGTANNSLAADGAQGSNADGAIATAPGSGFAVGPVSFNAGGVSVGGTTVISREYFNDKLRTLNLLRRGAEEFVFPLAIPSPITSLFGWRTHPIFGDRRFHTGTDLGAPEGTPVLATKDGSVHVADYLGGYGYTVILRHDDGSLETRYAHLSQILVRPGETVKQGEVVGLVGSTGNSTGPHLHFELRELTAQGWVLLDPNELMGYAVANLVDAINNPMQALGLAAAADKDSAKVEGASELPYRPAQPNAN